MDGWSFPVCRLRPFPSVCLSVCLSVPSCMCVHVSRPTGPDVIHTHPQPYHPYSRAASHNSVVCLPLERLMRCMRWELWVGCIACGVFIIHMTFIHCCCVLVSQSVWFLSVVHRSKAFPSLLMSSAFDHPFIIVLRCGRFDEPIDTRCDAWNKLRLPNGQ